jgi:RNA-directed DNA polymerase
MQNEIKRQIKLLCQRAIQRKSERQQKSREYGQKFEKRTKQKAGSSTGTVTYPHKHFDPIYCKRNANFLAKTLWHKIQEGKYEPLPAVRFEVPKAG